MKNVLLTAAFGLFLMGCSKENKEFTLKSIQVKAYNHSATIKENVTARIVETGNPQNVLANTQSYPNNLPLPVTLSVSSTPKLKLYKDHYTVQLWGDSTGLIGSSDVDMKEYKIIFPLEMETKSEDASFSISGSWK